MAQERAEERQAPARAPQRPAVEQRWVFRWELLLVPAVILLGVALLEYLAGAGVSWDAVMAKLGVPYHNRGRYTHVGVLGVVLIAVLLVVRTIRRI